MPESGKNTRKNIKKYLSPVFLVMLLIAFGLWYIKKLSYTYTTDIPITVSVMGQNLKTRCMAEGTGYNLFAYRHLLSTKVLLDEEDLLPSPGVTGSDVYIIDMFALQNAISVKLSDLRIISVDEPPKVVLAEETVAGE